MNRTRKSGALARRDGLWLLALAGVSALFFAPHLAGLRLFVGDADRINTLLNLRKYAVDGLRAWGYVPTWNERMFTGYGTSGLHWMVPEADPSVYLGALLPESWLLWYSGWLSCLLLFAAGVCFYALARSYVQDRFAAFVAACSYVFSCFAVTRLCQVDQAYSLLIFMPLGVLALRVCGRRPASCFAGMALLVAVMATFTFLQEVAYVFLMLGLYSVHRSIATRSWLPIGICAGAMLVGIVFSLPRIYTVYEAFSLLDRGSVSHSTASAEILRWLDDGIFGRNPAEVSALGNGVNLREGLQIQSSTFATLLLLGGIARWRGLGISRPALVFLFVLACILAKLGPLALVLGVSGVLWLGGIRAWAAPDAEHRVRDPDLGFHIVFLALSLAAILLPELRWLLDRAFLDVDFAHSRITIAALIPANVLTAVFLGQISARGASEASPEGDGEPTTPLRPLAWLASLAFALVAVLGALAVFLPPDKQIRMEAPPRLFVLQLASTLAATILFAALFRVMRTAPQQRARLVLVLGLLMLLQAFGSAFSQVWGASAQTWPEPFRGNNYFAAPAGALQPPNAELRRALRDRLDNDRYRTAILAPRSSYSGFPQPHVSDFWQLRVVGGYSAGVPRTLAGLPWPEGVREPRTLSFPSETAIDWPLLAYMNVRYVTYLDTELYFNVRSDEAPPVPGLEAAQLRIVENPAPVVPRHFFAARVIPAAQLPAPSGKPETPTGSAFELVATAVAEGAIMLSWRAEVPADASFHVERRDGPEAQLHELAVIPATAQGYLSPGLTPGTEYGFRIRTRFPDGSEVASATLSLRAAQPGLEPPRRLRAERLPGGVALLTWTAEPGAALAVELADAQGRFSPAGQSPPGASSLRLGGLRTGLQSLRARLVGARGSSPHAPIVQLLPSDVERDARGRVLWRNLPGDPRELSVSDAFAEPRDFSSEGELGVEYRGDAIDVRVSPASVERFLVLNERHDPRWQASADGQPLRVLLCNSYMRGIVVPPGVQHIELRYVPFLHTRTAAAISLAAVLLGVVGWAALRRFESVSPRARVATGA